VAAVSTFPLTGRRCSSYSSPMSRRHVVSLLACGAVGVFLVNRGWSLPQEEELDALKVCTDTQKLILENAFVRVIDDRIPPGVTEPKHRHPHGLSVTMTDADTDAVVYPAGSSLPSKPTRRHAKAGNVTWQEAVVHEVHNVGTSDSHTIRIELK
jgi:hypothetical protein